MHIGEEIAHALCGWGDAPVCLQENQARGITATTSREFSQRIRETTSQLRAWGIREKYLVPILLGNSTDFITVFLSLLRIGAIPVLAKLDYRTLELNEIFNNAQPQAVIAEQGHLRFLKPYLQNAIVITRAENKFSLAQSAEGLEPREDVPDDTASINYTYRGYGYPLGAMISHDQYLHGARVLQDGLQAEAGEKMLLMLPMTHIFTIVGCILVPLLNRTTIVVVDTMHPRLLFQYIRDLRIEYVTSVPEIYELLSRLRDHAVDLPSLRVFISGGSVLPTVGYEGIKSAFSVDLCHGYGLTEFAPVSGNRRHEARAGTVGPLCDQVKCRIDASAPDGSGEILIKTPRETGVYYRRPRESEEAHRDGWFRTGDMGRFDEGHLVFLKELKNTRKINGNLVDMEEVSCAISLDKDVENVQVGSDNNGLFARLALSRRVDFNEKKRRLNSSLREILAEYKIPKRLSVLP